MKDAWIVAGMLALVAGPPAIAADKLESSRDLVGGYTIVSGEKYGEKEPAERIKGATVRITEDRIVVTDKDKTEVYGSEYKLDAGKSPARITMTSKLAPSEDKVAKGLIEKDGDTVRLIYALPGGDMPTDFKTKDKQLMFVMKNMKK